MTVVLLAGVLAGGGMMAHGQIGGDEPGGHTGNSEPAARPALPRGPVRISAGVMASQLVTKVAPVYPASLDASGTMVIRVLVGKDGRVMKAEVVAGPEVLREAALDAVKQWVYKPYLLNGEPTEVDTTVVITMNRNGSS